MILSTGVERYEGQSKITESWLISFYWVGNLAETLCTYRMNLWAVARQPEDRLSAMCVRADDISD